MGRGDIIYKLVRGDPKPFELHRVPYNPKPSDVSIHSFETYVALALHFLQTAKTDTDTPKIEISDDTNLTEDQIKLLEEIASTGRTLNGYDRANRRLLEKTGQFAFSTSR